MKRIFLILFLLFFLVSCERPANEPQTSSTPLSIELTSTALPSPSPSPAPIKKTPAIKISPTPYPTLDFRILPAQLPACMKGYDLLSWQMGEDWIFTLITGTNRNKTFQEIMSPESQVTKDGFVKITVAGVEELKKVLNLLPANEWITWGGMDLAGQVPSGTVYFTFPPQDVIEDLTTYCKVRHVTLTSLKEQ
jgi:hypothetical protein